MRTGQDEEENDKDERTKFNGGGLTSCKNILTVQFTSTEEEHGHNDD